MDLTPGRAKSLGISPRGGQAQIPGGENPCNTGNLNCQGKFNLLRVIGVSSYRVFEQKDQKHLIKVVYAYTCFIVRFLAM